MTVAYSRKTRQRFPGAVASAQKLNRDHDRETEKQARKTKGTLNCLVCLEEERFHPMHPRTCELTVLCDGEVVRIVP